MPELRRSIAGWIALAALAVLFVACPSRRQGPDIPDLDEKTREASRRFARTEKIRTVMNRDLEQFRGLAEKLHNPPRELFSEPFPLDLFKHVVVECLNAPATGPTSARASSPDTGRSPTAAPDVGDRSVEPGASVDLRCSARFVDKLRARLESDSRETRRRAFDVLGRVDRFHELRIRLRRRIAKIKGIVSNNRDLLASRRAALRKLRARWKARRGELRATRWRELQDRFDSLESDLEELERETDRLESAADEWPDVIDRANYRVYFAITSRWNRSE